MAACALQSASVLGKSSAFSSSNTFCGRTKRPIIPSSSCIPGRRRYHTTAAASKSPPAQPPDRKEPEKAPLTGPAHTDAPKGKFDGYGAPDAPVPYTTRKDATYVSFKFKKDVPLRTVLNFTDACQGFGTFNGVSLKGRLILPNIYKAYNNKPHLIDAPWVKAAASVPGAASPLSPWM